MGALDKVKLYNMVPCRHICWSFDGKQVKKIAHENAVLRVSPRRKALHDRGFKVQLKQAKK